MRATFVRRGKREAATTTGVLITEPIDDVEKMTTLPSWRSVSVAVAVFLPFATTFLTPLPKEDYHAFFLSLGAPPVSNGTVSDHLRSLTARPHVAGSPADAQDAAYVLSVLSSAGLQTHTSRYDVLLTLPSFRSLILSGGSGPPISLPLAQIPAPGDTSIFSGELTPTFHAYSPSGPAVGPVVYANYGRVEDFSVLADLGINVSGSIVLARYGKIFRGDIVQNAYRAGAIGVVIYTDPADYGSESSWFPDSKWMPPSGVQVGTVYSGVGDPTTPGWASVAGSERAEPDADAMPRIPSIPVSSSDAAVIMREIGGIVAGETWHGRLDVPAYRLGPGSAVLNLTYIAKESITTIENVFAVIEGSEEPDRYVLLGNHRDAWTYGAADPNSGTATLLEISRRLEKLLKRGWKPRRTIILCSWDAEEYGLIGSTEWVEENREMLRSKAIAYVNVDVAVSGPGFNGYATPQLDDFLKKVTQQVEDPDNSSRTVYDAWKEAAESPVVGRLGGGGSDYAPFLQHVGVPAMDMFFGGDYPVYHSIYDDYLWMEKFGDPMFSRHVAVASIWGLVALGLADYKILPLNYLSYATELQVRAEELEAGEIDGSVSFIPLLKSIQKLRKSAIKVNKQKDELEREGWLSKWTRKHTLLVRDLNDRLMMAERAFTDPDGLFGRPWYKHMVYAPSRHNDYGSTSFPGIVDSVLEANNSKSLQSWKLVQHEIWRAARVITQASLVLSGKFT